jgi:transposase-like protein
MSNLAQVGDFCPNKNCPDYGQLQRTKPRKNLKKAGKTQQGAQRYPCKTCGATFTETKGTVFYRRRTKKSEIIETLALIAEGSLLSSLSRVKGYKADTIGDWLLNAIVHRSLPQAAADHAEAIEEMLLKEYQLSRGQLDALWSYVGNKGGKEPTPAVSFGVQR